MRHRLVVTILATLVLALAAFAGTSLAGNGHGNGGGGQDQSSSTSPSSPATGGDNSHGVKPSNTTKHDTYAKASSDKTKQYGNGKTAGQIATQAGYGDATLHGPGNSQPHKTSCGGHEVDVHALKSHGSHCGAPAPTTEAKQQPAVVTHVEKVHVEKVHVKKVEEHKTETPKAEEHKPAPVAPATPAPVTQSQVQGVSTSAHEHVTICHATGSSTNPYVRISPSASGVFHGHLGHQDGRDIVPPFVWNGQTLSENWDANGQSIWNAGCVVPTTTPQAVAVTSTPAPAPAAPAAPAPAAPAAPAPTNAAVGGVKGATVTLTPKAKPVVKPSNRTAAAATSKPASRGGVLGATTRLGNTVAGTTLPFTGLPLWIFVAVAAALILIGAAVRRSAHDRV